MLESIPVVQIVGYQNAGKTTLMEHLIAYYSENFHYRLLAVKHDAHGFAMDREGKDSWRHRQAGAAASAVLSKGSLGLTMAFPPEADLAESVRLLTALTSFDAVLVEGYKLGPYPKIAMIRQGDDVHEFLSLPGLFMVLFEDEIPLPEVQFPGVAAARRSDARAVIKRVDRYLRPHR